MGRSTDLQNYHGEFDDNGRNSDTPFFSYRGTPDSRVALEYERLCKMDDGLDGDELEYCRETPIAMEWDNLGQRRIIERDW